MKMSPKNTSIANDLRKLIQRKTETVSDGEGIAMILLWTFLLDHAKYHDLDVIDLAREQLEAFISYADSNLKLVQEH